MATLCLGRSRRVVVPRHIVETGVWRACCVRGCVFVCCSAPVLQWSSQPQRRGFSGLANRSAINHMVRRVHRAAPVALRFPTLISRSCFCVVNVFISSRGSQATGYVHLSTWGGSGLGRGAYQFCAAIVVEHPVRRCLRRVFVQKKRRTHVDVEAEWQSGKIDVPRSFVVRKGKVGTGRLARPRGLTVLMRPRRRCETALASSESTLALHWLHLN